MNWSRRGGVVAAYVFLICSSTSIAQKKEAPVSVAEAQTVLMKTEEVLSRVLRLPRLKSTVSSLSPSSQLPVTRQEVQREYHRLFLHCRSKFKFTPRSIRFDPALLRPFSTSKDREELETLVKWGFVAPIGPLATNTKSELTIQEFGDSLGYFLTRMADLTHMPSSKFSPFLMGVGDSASKPKSKKEKKGIPSKG